ncbi:hypothetical protein Tco_0731430, partial [Tanacetum coccineum]
CMTRSSNKELVKPYDEPEQVGNQGNNEGTNYGGVHDKTREDCESGVARPKFEKDAKFELKGQFLKEIRDHTFSGSENEDENDYIESVLEIVDLFTTPDVTMDQLMLRVFPITLTGAASIWLRNEPAGSITTWEILKGKFLSRYCPPSRTAKKMEEINNFLQESDETLYRAWERFKELLLRCPQHYITNIQEVILFYKGLDVPTRQILDSKGAQLNNLGREIKKVNERVYAAQVGCELCNGPHYSKDCPLKEEGKTLEEAYYTQFGVPVPNTGRYSAAAPGFYQRDNGNPSYQERRQTMEESLNKFMVEFSKRHDENSFLIKEIRASTDAVIRNQGASIKALEIQIRQMSKSITTTEEADISLIRRIGPDQYTEVLMKLKKLQVNSTESAKSLRRLLKEKSRIEEEIKATMYEHCLTTLKEDLPQKEKDLGSFTLPCKINDMCFDKALADLGASVSLMPYSTFTNLGLGKLAPTKLIIELADKTMKRPKGIAENVLVEIDRFAFPIDFIVLDMPKDIKILLILGTPFLSTDHANIDVFKRKFALRIGNDKIVFKSDNPTSNIIEKVYVSQDTQFGDFLELNDLYEPLELRNHENEDFDLEIEEGEIINEPMVEVVKIRHDNERVEKIDEYPSFYDYDRKIHINYFIVMENMDACRDKDMGDVILGNHFVWMRVLKQDGSMD